MQSKAGDQMTNWDEAYLALPLEQKRITRRFKVGVKRRQGLTGDKNQCPACGEWFNSTSAFDSHRTGGFGKLAKDGKPGQPAKRRCLSLTEMQEKGFVRNDELYWITRRNERYSECLF